MTRPPNHDSHYFPSHGGPHSLTCSHCATNTPPSGTLPYVPQSHTSKDQLHLMCFSPNIFLCPGPRPTFHPNQMAPGASRGSPATSAQTPQGLQAIKLSQMLEEGRGGGLGLQSASRGGAACCSATGCLGCCYVSCCHGSSPTHFPARLQAHLPEAHQIGSPEGGHLLQTSDWVMPEETAYPHHLQHSHLGSS